MSQDYAIPALPVGDLIEVETEVKRSRFICFIGRVNSRNEALSLHSTLKQQYPDASHHCLAFIAGVPDGNVVAGFDDDGEPGGVAGKPMLNVLQHKKIGGICAVVVRQFGGMKLGAGGLVRAYSSAVQAACEELSLKQKFVLAKGVLVCEFEQEQLVRHCLNQLQVEFVECYYGEQVMLLVTVPRNLKSEVSRQLFEFTHGQVKIDRIGKNVAR